MTTNEIQRRTVLRGTGMVAAGAAAGVVLTACGSQGGSAASTTSSAAPTGEAVGIGGAVPSSSAVPGQAKVLGPVADVAVGSGVVYAGDKVVVTQPTAGTFKGFDAICTHQGCVVSEIKGSSIVCNCHGSEFSIADGSVVKGPATTALPPANVTVSGDSVTLSA